MGILSGVFLLLRDSNGTEPVENADTNSVVATSGPPPTPDTPTAIPTQAAETPTSAPSLYVVQAGDTLIELCERLKTAEMEVGECIAGVVRLNGLSGPDEIAAGQTLILPGDGSSSTPEQAIQASLTATTPLGAPLPDTPTPTVLLQGEPPQTLTPDQLAKLSMLGDQIRNDTSAYLSSAKSSLHRDSALIQSLFDKHRSFNSIINSPLSSQEYRRAILAFYQDLVLDYPLIYGNNVLSSSEFPFAGAFRAQAHWNVVDAQILTGAPPGDVSAALGLSGIKREIYETHGVLIVDNGGLDAQQLRSIGSMLSLVPSDIHVLHNIAVNELIGNEGNDFLPVWSPTGIYILAPKVGSAPENSFPSDIESRSSDLFNLVLAHELNHMIDSPANGKSGWIRSRVRILIDQAGADSLNYLRSMFDDGFFQAAPQEFFASIANEYFADSELTFHLGLQRFAQSRSEPLNQFLFFADVYSLGGTETFFYALDAAGNLSRSRIPVIRDGQGRVVGINVGGQLYEFDLDRVGNVTSVRQ